MLKLHELFIFLLLTGVTVHSQSLCLLSIAIFEITEWGLPEYYIKCNNKLIAQLPVSEKQEMTYDPPICLEENMSVHNNIKCTVYEDDLLFDDNMGTFVVLGSVIHDAKEPINITVKDRFDVEVGLCTCAEKTRKKEMVPSVV